MSVLEKILDSVRDGLDGERRRVPLAAIRSAAEGADRAPSFREALERPGTSLIAETKQRSPSRAEGFLPPEEYRPVELARQYESAGARAMSVLTEPEFFGGAPEHLREVREACGLPVLRKDFLVDPYQCWQAKAWGASAALLIVAALEDDVLRDLHMLLGELGMDALVEAHTEEEAERALALPARILGVNNRSLKTFVTDRRVTAAVARLVPAGTILVSESGISTRPHVLEVEAAGARAVLVGEALVASGNPAAKVAELVGTEGGAA